MKEWVMVIQYRNIESHYHISKCICWITSLQVYLLTSSCFTASADQNPCFLKVDLKSSTDQDLNPHPQTFICEECWKLGQRFIMRVCDVIDDVISINSWALLVSPLWRFHDVIKIRIIAGLIIYVVVIVIIIYVIVIVIINVDNIIATIVTTTLIIVSPSSSSQVG